ncbi:MAG: efflux RND transporter permease subunit [Bacteroidales bacterium]|nr:efflux RND transporter permease subunit [Bacteroidales bacterium]
MSIYEGAVKRPIMTTLVFVAIAVFGLFSLSKLPIDLYPDIDSDTIMVMETYPGASAEDIENNVTRPLENTLNSVNYLKHITSKSQENYSIVTLQFEYGHDIDALTNDVRDKLDMISQQLPDGAGQPIIFKFSADMIPILILSAQARESSEALYKILDDQVANPIARVPGVGTVSVTGAPERTIYVYCDPDKLEAYNIQVETISQIIGMENRNVPGGSFDAGNNAYTMRVKGEFKDPKEMENIVVSARGNQIVYLKDVARVVDTVQERAQKVTTYFTNANDPKGFSGENGAMIIVQKQSGANSVAISEQVLAKLTDIQRNLPSDVTLGVIVNTSENIYATIGSLEETIMYAMIFVAIVCFLFLGRWRAVVVIVITIPLSLVASFIYLAATGSSLNMISLSCLSIAIGNVVDDAIVVLENVTNHIERGSEPKQAAIHGTNEVAISVIASTLTMIGVFFPLTMVTGMAGVLFKELGWMMCIIMCVSTVSALSFTPMLCSQMLKLKKRENWFSRWYEHFVVRGMLDKLDRWYAKRINWAVRHRKTMIISILVFFVVSMSPVFLKLIGTGFFPQADLARISVSLELPIGTRQDRAEEIGNELATMWMSRWGTEEQKVIKACNFTTGQADTDNTFASMQSNGTHIISFNVYMYSVADRKMDVSMYDVGRQMRQDLKQYPELVKVQVTEGGSQGGMGGQSTAGFEIYGYDMLATDSLARILEKRMLTVPGVNQTTISRSDYQPEIQVDFDREKLAQYGLNLATAGSYLRNRFNGSTASYFREDGEEYDIVVRYTPEVRESVETLENVLLYGTNGSRVRIKDVGTVVERFSQPVIERKDRQRVNTLTCVVDGEETSLSKVVEAGRANIEAMRNEGLISGDVDIIVAGSYEEQQESFADMGMLGVLILLIVFIVMAAQFESWSDPFIIMLISIPFTFTGIVLALWITGVDLNIMSLLGGIMLIGIVVKNGIVLIDYIHLQRERGLSVIQAVVISGRSRLRPVLMTTATTILGMLPMAIGTGQGSEMWQPMGIAIIGGLLVSTVMTLVVVPSVYCQFQGTKILAERRSWANQLGVEREWKKKRHFFKKRKAGKVTD